MSVICTRAAHNGLWARENGHKETDAVSIKVTAPKYGSLRNYVTALNTLFGEGLISAAGTIALAIIAYWRFTPWVRVKMNYGIAREEDGALNEEQVCISAVNSGHKPVTLNQPFVHLPNGNVFVPPQENASVEFPYKLGPEESCDTYIDAPSLAQHLAESYGYRGEVRLLPSVTDKVDREYYGNYFWLNIDRHIS